MGSAPQPLGAPCSPLAHEANDEERRERDEQADGVGGGEAQLRYGSIEERADRRVSYRLGEKL